MWVLESPSPTPPLTSSVPYTDFPNLQSRFPPLSKDSNTHPYRNLQIIVILCCSVPGTGLISFHIISFDSYNKPMGVLLWVELCLPKKYDEVLTPGTCEFDHFWKQGH